MNQAQIPPATGQLAARSHAEDTDAQRSALILKHRALVGHIVRDLLSRLPGHVDRGDLVSAGLVALTMAARSWQEDRGVPFARYAAIRIRGAVTDELRSLDWASRGVRSRARAIADARSSLQSDLGRAPTDAELEITTGFSVEKSRPRHQTWSGPASSASTPRPGRTGLPRCRRRHRTLRHCSWSGRPWGTSRTRSRNCRSGCGSSCVPTSSSSDRWPTSRPYWASRISQLRSEAVRLLRAALHEPLQGAPEAETQTFGPRIVAARQAYVASVATRSSMAQRLRHTNALAESRSYTALENAG